MVGHASERSHIRRSEVGDIPTQVGSDERERSEIEEPDRQEPKEPREPREAGDEVESRLRRAIDDLEVQERSEETISQRMERALGGLEEPEKSTEQRLREVLETQEESVNDTEPELREDTAGNTLTDDDRRIESKETERTINDSELELPNPRDLVSDSDDNVRVESRERVEEPVNDNEPELQTKIESHEDSLSNGGVRFESMEEVDKAIQQHPHMKNGFSPESHESCEQYIRAISEEEVSSKEIAETENLDEITVEKWRDGAKPNAIHSIEGLETKRLEHEANIPEEALEHRIHPQDVHDVTSDALEKENLSVKELTDIVHNIHQKIDNPDPSSIHYAELYDSEKPLTEDGLRDIAVEIRSNREVIQSELNTRLGLDDIPDHEIRIGVTDSRLYYWHINTSPDEWVNVLADQKFYMSKEDKTHLIDEMRVHLHIRGGGQTSEYYLNDLINQLSGLEDPAANRIRKYDSVYSFDGEVMHIIADLQGKSLEDFKEVITHMGTKEAARVSNLQFPEIHKFRMRFVAIGESDGNVDTYGRFSYYEKNVKRRRIVTDFYQEFGDFVVKERQEGGKLVALPKVYGAMAEYWGIPRGDKGIHNIGLHDSITNDTLENKVNYPIEMVGEDGCITGTRVSIRRHHVLHAGSKEHIYTERFGIKPVVSQEHIDLVLDKGTDKDVGLNYKPGDVVVLTIKELENLEKVEDSRLSRIAKELHQIISDNPNRLLEDEVHKMIRPLGIEMTSQPAHLRYYRESKRLSVVSSAHTSTVDDAIRWVLIAPPNHPTKMQRAVDLVQAYQTKTQSIKRRIIDDGLDIHPTWNEYGL